MAEPKNKTRALFCDNHGKIVTSLFVLRDKTTLTLMHDYPDFLPQPSWTAKGRGFSLEIRSVNGRVLTCVEV
jgi:hypothetical protein